ncbi:unnamed protein product [Closterium sp. Yama58-4]|nr:unnamed protein product [Closterium sp. Yama58-4]
MEPVPADVLAAPASGGAGGGDLEAELAEIGAQLEAVAAVRDDLRAAVQRMDGLTRQLQSDLLGVHRRQEGAGGWGESMSGSWGVQVRLGGGATIGAQRMDELTRRQLQSNLLGVHGRQEGAGATGERASNDCPALLSRSCQPSFLNPHPPLTPLSAAGDTEGAGVVNLYPSVPIQYRSDLPLEPLAPFSSPPPPTNPHPPLSLPAVQQAVQKARESVPKLQAAYAELAAIIARRPGEFYRFSDHWRSQNHTVVSQLAFAHWLDSGTLLSHKQLEEQLQCIKYDLKKVEEVVYDVEMRCPASMTALSHYSAPITLCVCTFDIPPLPASIKYDLKKVEGVVYDVGRGIKYDLKKVEEVVYDVEIRGLAKTAAEPMQDT